MGFKEQLYQEAMAQGLEFRLKKPQKTTCPFAPPIHSQNTVTVSHTKTMDSARQKAVANHMSARSAQRDILNHNAHKHKVSTK